MNIYSDELLLAVWSKAEEVYGYDARIWRKDLYMVGILMKWYLSFIGEPAVAIA